MPIRKEKGTRIKLVRKRKRKRRRSWRRIRMERVLSGLFLPICFTITTEDQF